MALVPQPPLPPLSAPPGGPAPLSGFWLGVAAAALAVASVIGAFFKEIAARWRGIVVAHLFFLTLWMAIQVFFFATGAHWCVPSNGSRAVEWLTRSFAPVARCGPAPTTPATFQGGASAMAAPAPTQAPAPPRPPGAIPAPQTQSSAASPGASASASVGAAARTPPAAAAQQAAPASALAQSWSAKSIANCWRNRAVDSGDCYETGDPRRRPAPPPQQPPRYRYPDGYGVLQAEAPPPVRPRYRYPYDPPPSRYFPCRPGECWPNEYWRDDDL